MYFILLLVIFNLILDKLNHWLVSSYTHPNQWYANFAGLIKKHHADYFIPGGGNGNAPVIRNREL